jgi:tetratricopeptide (TPR) repeat protein
MERIIFFVFLLLAGFPVFSQDSIHEFVKRGIFKAKIGDYPSAIEDFNRAIALDSTRAEPWYNRGVVKAETGDYHGAIRDFRQATLNHPTYAEPWLGMGDAFSQLGDHSNAILDYNKAISLKPEETDAYYKRGLEFIQTGNWNDAALDFTRVTNMDPDNPGAWYNLGLARFNLKDYAGSISAIDSAIGIDSTGFEYFVTRGAANGATGNYLQALTDLEKALILNPGFEEALYNKGLVLLYLKRYAEAEAAYDEVIRRNPSNGSAWEGRGVARQYLGDQPGACSDWRQASALGSGKATEYLKKYCSG